MSIFHSLLLSAIQSLCEFLPISSSAHLILIPWFLNFKPISLSFDISLHLGTTVAILIFFRTEFKELILGFLSIFFKQIKANETYKRLSILVLISIIPIIIAGPFLKKYSETSFQNPILISGCLIIFGFLLYYFDKKSETKYSTETMTKSQALIIGTVQVLALVPGVSRSGATITAARILKINKETAAKFSFIMATPSILGAAVLDMKDIIKTSQTDGLFLPLCIGFFATAILSYATIKFFMKYIQSHNFKIFYIYRIILAVTIFGVYFAKR